MKATLEKRGAYGDYVHVVARVQVPENSRTNAHTVEVDVRPEQVQVVNDRFLRTLPLVTTLRVWNGHGDRPARGAHEMRFIGEFGTEGVADALRNLTTKANATALVTAIARVLNGEAAA